MLRKLTLVLRLCGSISLGPDGCNTSERPRKAQGNSYIHVKNIKHSESLVPFKLTGDPLRHCEVRGLTRQLMLQRYNWSMWTSLSTPGQI